MYQVSPLSLYYILLTSLLFSPLIIVGGPNRPPSARQIAQERLDSAASRSTTTNAAGGNPHPQKPPLATQNSSEEGYWAYMQRTMQERTQSLGLTGDKLDDLQGQSSGWQEDVGKFVGKQKRKALLGVVGSKFGL